MPPLTLTLTLTHISTRSSAHLAVVIDANAPLSMDKFIISMSKSNEPTTLANLGHHHSPLPMNFLAAVVH
jgi:hypothetical protein